MKNFKSPKSSKLTVLNAEQQRAIRGGKDPKPPKHQVKDVRGGEN